MKAVHFGNVSFLSYRADNIVDGLTTFINSASSVSVMPLV